jgi:transcriptional regulator GlxA family with amidase domain
MKKICILILEQSVPTGIVSFVDIFKMASACSKRFEIEIVSVDGKPIRYSNYLEITPDKSVEEALETDLILIPSSGYSLKTLGSYPATIMEWLKNQNAKKTGIAGCCTGVFVLAEAGLLKNKEATTHWAYATHFMKRFPETNLFYDKIITEDGNIFCSGGGTAGIDLCLYLIEKYCGKKTATLCAKNLLIERGRDTQSPFEVFKNCKKHKDFDIKKAQNWIEKYFDSNFQLDDVSSHVGMSIRNFKRRFKIATGEPPLVYIQKLRVDAAKNLLENRPSAIDEIARKVGYDDVGFFRKLFSRHTGISPSLYRQKFNSQH